MSRGWYGRAALAIVVRPSLWAIAVLQVGRLAVPGWWRRWPPIPAPDPAYLRFRLQTQYGDSERDPDPSDLVAYLHWCKSYGKVTG